MKRNRILIALPIAAVFAIVLYIVFVPSPPPEPKIAFLLKTLENPFFIEMKEGIDTYINENNLSEKYEIDIKAGKSESDVETQRQMLEQYISKKYDVICITPSSSSALNNTIAKAIREGIQIVVVDTKLDEANLQLQGVSIAAYVGSNNYNGGQLAADYILRKSRNQNPRIVFLEGVPDQETAQQRKQGFLDVLSTRHISPVDNLVADWNKQKAFDMMNVLLARNLQFDAIFASNDQMALGAIEALERNRINPAEKIIVGFDAIPEAIKAIKDMRLTATVRQKPRDMGFLAMQIALSIVHKKPYANNNPIPVEMID